jgi:hypothetical protein
MKIRIEGVPAEVELAAATIRATFVVIEESRDYDNQRRDVGKVRRYFTVQLREAEHGPGK